MNTKGPTSPTSYGNNYNFVIIDAFTHYYKSHSKRDFQTRD